MGVRTFVDASVLILAVRGAGTEADAAFAALDDPERELVYSEFVRLEVLPKAEHHNRPPKFARAAEVTFYRGFFDRAERVNVSADEILARGMAKAREDGTGPMDSLHVAAALLGGCTQLLTLERKRTKGTIHRATGLEVVGIGD